VREMQRARPARLGVRPEVGHKEEGGGAGCDG
jgi:hypothetical protein